MHRQLLFLLPLVLAATFFDGIEAFGPRPASAQQFATKSCGACGASVPLSSQAGGNCPSCGAYWSQEVVGGQSYGGYGSGYGAPSRGYDGYPRPLTPAEAAYLWQLEKLRQREIKRERIGAYARERRAAQAVRRRATYERLAARTEQFRLNDDPVQRAAAYRATAARCELEGNFNAADAYYRLAERTLAEVNRPDPAAIAWLELDVR